MRVLVTGANGYLGRRIVAALHDRGHEPVPTDLAASCHDVDIADREHVHDLLRVTSPAAVVHTAAALMPACDADPIRASTVNITGTANLLEAATATGVPRFLTVSSVAVYGQQRPDRLFVESDPPAPTSTYGAMKVITERMTKVTFREAGVIVRLGTLFGGVARRERLFAPVDVILQGLASGAERVVIPYPRDESASMIHVDDAAHAIMQLVTRSTHQAPLYNLAGTTLSVEAIADLAERITGLRIECGDTASWSRAHSVRSDLLTEHHPDIAIDTMSRLVQELQAARG